MASEADLKFILSGGAANTDPAAAPGGAISTAGGGVILSQSITASTIAGITHDDAAGNAVGTGTVSFTASGTTLQWAPPGGAIGPAVNITPSGVYTAYGADGVAHIKITSVTGSFGADASQVVAIANQTNKLFDDVARAESVTGDTEYRCMYAKNAHGSDDMVAVKLWIDADAAGVDSLAIGLDPVGKNGTATTIATEGDAPSGVTFSSPTTEVSGLDLGTLAAGDYYAIWVRRVVPSATTTSTSADTSRLKLRFV